MQQAEKSTLPKTSSWENENPTFTVRGQPVRPWLVLTALVFGFFMALLDATIVNIAIPTIEDSLHADLTTVSWVLNAYNLVFAVLLVTVGRFADIYGRKRIFMAGMILFSIGSLCCALAQTFGDITHTAGINWLIGFRALQAFGAAGLAPVSLAVIMSVFPKEQRGAAIGVWGALSGLASAVGPVLGGFLVQNFDWRWIFFVNLPFCVVGLLLVALFVPETRDPRVSRSIDIPGMITLTIAIFCLVLAIIEGNDWGWTSAPVLALFGGALVGLIIFAIVERLQKSPIIDFSLFKAISFTGANITMFLFGIAIQGAFLIFVLYFTNGLGYSQLNAAYAILPIPLASFVVAAVSGRLSNRINPYYMSIAGQLLLAIGFGSLFLISADAAYIETVWRSILLGAGMGMIFQSLPSISLSQVPRAKLGVGSGVFNTFRQIGFALGVAILITVFTGTLTPNLEQARDNSIAIVRSSNNLPDQLREGIVSGLQKANFSSSSSDQNSFKKTDLTQAANHLPPQTPQQTRNTIRQELKNLGDRINHEFTTQVIASFKSAWLVAAIFSIIGFFTALISFLAQRSKGQLQSTEPSPEAVHATIG